MLTHRQVVFVDKQAEVFADDAAVGNRHGILFLRQ